MVKISTPATSPWAAAVASVTFLDCTRYFSGMSSGAYHCAKVVRHYAYQYPQLRAELGLDLDWLTNHLTRTGVGRVFALVFALWALCGKPRWPGYVALGLWLADTVTVMLSPIE